jgi:hypothetical protein
LPAGSHWTGGYRVLAVKGVRGATWQGLHTDYSSIAMAVARLRTPVQYAAATDHSYGLRIAGGMSMVESAVQRLAIEAVNAPYEGRFRLLQGIEANIDAAGISISQTKRGLPSRTATSCLRPRRIVVWPSNAGR